MEAATHVLQTINDKYQVTGANFQMLLGMAFMELSMEISRRIAPSGLPPGFVPATPHNHLQ